MPKTKARDMTAVALTESGAPLEVRSYMRQLAEWSVANWPPNGLVGGSWIANDFHD